MGVKIVLKQERKDFSVIYCDVFFLALTKAVFRLLCESGRHA